MSARSWWAALLCLLYVLFGFHVKQAHAMRAALVVGNNTGVGNDEGLRYAESDAESIALLLSNLAGFERHNVALVKGGGRAAFMQALADVSARLRSAPGEHLFFFYYSGHADGQALHLGAETVSFAELKAQVLALPVEVRILVVDACQSGALTRAKGGRPAVAFELSSLDESARGLAVLTSARDTELAQESDELKGSFFTRYFDSGLRGLADRNHDGRVSLDESFDYASERTLEATLGTVAGPQHPTFRYDLVGQRNVVLTYPRMPGRGYGVLVFDVPGWYFVRRPQGAFLELASHGGEELVLETGRYEISRRGARDLEVAFAEIAPGERVQTRALKPTHYAFGRAVRKGGGLRSRAYAFSFSGVIRSPIESLGTAFGARAAGRLDGAAGSLELRASAVRAASDTRVPAETWDFAATVAGLRAWDFRALTFAGGVEAGWAVFHQQTRQERAEIVHAPTFGPTALFELPWGPRLYIRGDISVPIYVLPLQAGDDRHLSAAVSVRAEFGAGGYF